MTLRFDGDEFYSVALATLAGDIREFVGTLGHSGIAYEVPSWADAPVGTSDLQRVQLDLLRVAYAGTATWAALTGAAAHGAQAEVETFCLWAVDRAMRAAKKQCGIGSMNKLRLRHRLRLQRLHALVRQGVTDPVALAAGIGVHRATYFRQYRFHVDRLKNQQADPLVALMMRARVAK